jgi:large subunit ribosomal protein L15
MKLTDLRPAAGSHRTSKRVGRGYGSGKGKTAGKGMNGQKARSGPNPYLAFEGGQNRLTKRMPYLRGFKNRYRVAYQVLNVADLNELPANSSLTIAELIASGLIKASQPVKLLGDGELTVALTVQVHKASASAKQKVEAAGGTVIEKPWVLVRPTRSFGLHPSARGTRE